jgi:hypothetical protein
MPENPQDLWQAAEALGDLAANPASRHLRASQDAVEVKAAARTKESAWLLARLCQLLQAHLSA